MAKRKEKSGTAKSKKRRKQRNERGEKEGRNSRERPGNRVAEEK